jgi:hypothetical protein
MNIEDLNLDEQVILGLEPQTWYALVQSQIDLLRNHVEQLETQIGVAVNAYEREKVATDVEHDDERYPIIILEEHRGIEAPPYHLGEIFMYYFPNLQRRSTLIVLFSFLESQLDQLCKLFADTRRLNIIHTDLKGKGIDRSRRYLKKVIGLPLEDNSTVWQEITWIQKIRNVVVHNDAKLDDENIAQYVDRAQYLSLSSESYYSHDVDEINILEGYLTYILDTFDSYCRELNSAIETLLSPDSSHGATGN